MINFLTGTLYHCDEQEITLLTHGVGYAIFTGKEIADRLRSKTGEPIELWVHTYVREDQITLYGFQSAMERKLFQILNGVSGVGPKLAIGVISKLASDELVNAISMGNSTLLTSIPGIGRKMAERIILELKEKILGKLPELKSSAGSSLGGQTAVWRELTDALQGLGFQDQKIAAVIRWITQNEAVESIQLDQALKIALQKINQC